MLSRGLQIFLSVAIFICSTLAGMAQETISEEVRADYFVGSELGLSEQADNFVANGLGGEADNHRENTLNDAAVLPSLTSAGQTENRVDDGKKQKRKHRRTASFKINHSKSRIMKSLPAKSEARGVARDPQLQDAQQERTAAIRFLHLKSLPFS